MLNVDLSKFIDSNRQAGFKSAQFIMQFRNLTFLSLHFTPQIELNEKLEGTESSQKFIQHQFLDSILAHCSKLKKLYLYACPIQRLTVRSDSLEKLCIYRAEFLELKELRCPKLKVLMYHDGLIHFFKHYEAKRQSQRQNYDVFERIYDGCPVIQEFNSIPVGNVRHFHPGKKEWCLATLTICAKRYQKLFNSGSDALHIHLG